MVVSDLKNLDRICMTATAVIACLCIGFAVQTITKRQKQIREKKKMIAERSMDLQAAMKSAEKLKAVLNEKKLELEAYSEKIPEKTAFGDFLDRLDTMMKKRNLVLINIQPQAAVTEKSLLKIPLRMHFKGAFIDIFKILYELETMERMVVVDRIDMAKSNIDECRVELTAKIFSR